MKLLWFNLATDEQDPLLGFACSWLRAMAETNESIDVITMREGKHSLPSNVRVHSLGKELGRSEPERLFVFYKKLIQILRERRIDACFSHMSPLFTNLAAPLLKARGVPIVTWYAHKQVSMTVKLAHLLSSRMVASAPTAYNYRRDHKFVPLCQGIDTALFSPSEALAKETRLTLLSVGRLSPIKDLLTLLNATRLLQDRGAPVQTVLIGDAPSHDLSYAKLLHDRVEELKLQDSVRFAGPMTNFEVPLQHRMAFAHVNLCPTGALDKAALEAMSSGLPSLVANDGFSPLLGKWKDALVFRHGNSEDLASKLGALIKLKDEEPSVFARMKSEMRKSVVNEHSIETLTRKLSELLASVGRVQ